jgi:oxygen-independent coproporphyrinogen III oxidase
MSERERAGLYVHVPFCRTKCPYCDFYSTTDHSLVDAWLNALQREVGLYKGELGVFDSIYLGGGTPSVLHDRQLATLMNCLHRELRFSVDTEITIEVNPDDITRERSAYLLDLGFNRISMGVQSLDEAELRFLKRRHDVPQTLRALESVRGSRCKSLGVDLIYGIEGQSTAGWLNTLGRVLEFEPEHMSCYQMTIERGTPLADLKDAGKLKPLGEKEETDFFLITSATLEDHGYVHYEISNFAKDADHISRHNSKYWRHVPYLGLGPGAHSFHRGFRWWNMRSVTQYCRFLARGRRPVEGHELLSREQLRLEALCLGLRTRDGADLELISHSPASRRVLHDLLESGVVRVVGNRLVPTRKGYLVADSLPVMLAS